MYIDVPFSFRAQMNRIIRYRSALRNSDTLSPFPFLSALPRNNYFTILPRVLVKDTVNKSAAAAAFNTPLARNRT